MYKEPFLLPMENLPVGLGDIRRLSVSNGLEERAEGQGAITARGDPGAQTRPGGLIRGMEAWRGPGLAWGHRHGLGTRGAHSQPPWERLRLPPP